MDPPAANPPAAPPQSSADRVLAGVSVAAIAFFLLQILTYGYGRDQGIYAVVARTVLEGGMPYRDAWDAERTLKHIEAKISELAGVFGAEALSGMSAPQRPAEQSAGANAPTDTSEPRQLSDAELLNGPQLPGNAIDQSEIDRLLAG